MPCGALKKNFLFLIKNTRSYSKRAHDLAIESGFFSILSGFFFWGFFEKVAKCVRRLGKGRPGALFFTGRHRFGVSLYDLGKFWMMDFVKGFARSVYYGF